MQNNGKLTAIKDFAEMMGVSTQSVSQKLTRYKEELEGHIICDGNRKFLDEYAVEFLKTKTRTNAMVISSEEERRAYDELDERYHNAVDEITSLNSKIDQLRDKIESYIKKENQFLLEKEEQSKLLLEKNDEINKLNNKYNDIVKSEAELSSKLQESETNYNNLASEKAKIEEELHEVSTMSFFDFLKYKKKLKKDGKI